MNRRDLLKGMLGGIGVAATPQALVKASEITESGIVLPMEIKPEIAKTTSTLKLFPYLVTSWQIESENDLQVLGNREQGTVSLAPGGNIELARIFYEVHDTAPPLSAGMPVHHVLPVDTNFAQLRPAIKGMIKENEVRHSRDQFTTGMLVVALEYWWWEDA
jgi:hypothetical protein